jgi:hypothetical protein
MRHEEFLGKIPEYREGTLDSSDRADWEAHRTSCNLCREIEHRWTTVDVPANFPAHVMGRIPTRVKKMPSGWVIRTGWAVAAALLVAAFWHPEKSWVKADRAFACFGITENLFIATSHLTGGNPHE